MNLVIVYVGVYMRLYIRLYVGDYLISHIFLKTHHLHNANSNLAFPGEALFYSYSSTYTPQIYLLSSHSITTTYIHNSIEHLNIHVTIPRQHRRFYQVKQSWTQLSQNDFYTLHSSVFVNK